VGVGVGAGDCAGAGGCDRVAVAVADADAERVGLPLGEGGAVVVGDVAPSGADPELDRGDGDGGVDGGVGDGSGTLARTSSGSALSRAGAS
jgi:hypothetical protein